MEKVTLGEEEPQLHGTRRWPAFCQPLCPGSSLYPRYSVGFWALSSGLYYGLLSRRLTGRAAWCCGSHCPVKAALAGSRSTGGSSWLPPSLSPDCSQLQPTALVPLMEKPKNSWPPSTHVISTFLTSLIHCLASIPTRMRTNMQFKMLPTCYSAVSNSVHIAQLL